MTAARVLEFAPTYVNDTSHFCRALDHFRYTTGCLVPFHELAPEQRSKVIAISQAFKMGLDVCEGSDQRGYHDQVEQMDCYRMGTVCSLTSERILCAEHFAESATPEVEEKTLCLHCHEELTWLCGKPFNGWVHLVSGHLHCVGDPKHQATPEYYKRGSK